MSNVWSSQIRSLILITTPVIHQSHNWRNFATNHIAIYANVSGEKCALLMWCWWNKSTRGINNAIHYSPDGWHIALPATSGCENIVCQTNVTADELRKMIPNSKENNAQVAARMSDKLRLKRNNTGTGRGKGMLRLKAAVGGGAETNNIHTLNEICTAFGVVTQFFRFGQKSEGGRPLNWKIKSKRPSVKQQSPHSLSLSLSRLIVFLLS